MGEKNSNKKINGEKSKKDIGGGRRVRSIEGGKSGSIERKGRVGRRE